MYDVYFGRPVNHKPSARNSEESGISFTLHYFVSIFHCKLVEYEPEHKVKVFVLAQVEYSPSSGELWCSVWQNSCQIQLGAKPRVVHWENVFSAALCPLFNVKIVATAASALISLVVASLTVTSCIPTSSCSGAFEGQLAAVASWLKGSWLTDHEILKTHSLLEEGSVDFKSNIKFERASCGAVATINKEVTTCNVA